jgi:hypothetical protein
MAHKVVDSIASIQEAEVAYLRTLIDIDLKKKGKIFSFETDLLARNHTCTNACAVSFKNLKCNQIFSHKGRSWHATGFVYVCTTSKRVHLCGLGCPLARIMPYCATATCPLTGLEIAQGECYARSREEVHVFRVGLSTISDYVPSKNAEGLTEKKALESIAQQAEDLNSQFQSNTERLIIHNLLLDERARLYPDEDEETRRSNVEAFQPTINSSSSSSSSSTSYDTSHDIIDGDEKLSKRTTHSLDLEGLLTIAGNNESLMYEMIHKHPGMDTASVAQKIVARREFYSCAAFAWERHSMKAEHVRHMQLALKRATVEWFKSIKLYYKGCISSNVPIDKFKVMQLFMLFVKPECEGLYYCFDIAALNIKSRTYYINCIVALWEKYQEVPAVAASTYKFKMCATAMLSVLRTGLVVDIFFRQNDPQPRIWGDLTPVEQVNARSVKVMLMDPHPNLILVSSEILREIENGEKQDDVTLEFPAGEKTVLPKPRSMMRGRATERANSTIVDRKPLNAVLEHIIRFCPTIDALERFSLAVVYPKEKTPSYILRN